MILEVAKAIGLRARVRRVATCLLYEDALCCIRECSRQEAAEVVKQRMTNSLGDDSFPALRYVSATSRFFESNHHYNSVANISIVLFARSYGRWSDYSGQS